MMPGPSVTTGSPPESARAARGPCTIRCFSRRRCSWRMARTHAPC